MCPNVFDFTQAEQECIYTSAGLQISIGISTDKQNFLKAHFCFSASMGKPSQADSGWSKILKVLQQFCF